MNVLIIPEDFRKDQHVLRPIIAKMFTAVGKPKANIQVCQDPLLGGVSEALKWERIAEVIGDWLTGVIRSPVQFLAAIGTSWT